MAATNFVEEKSFNEYFFFCIHNLWAQCWHKTAQKPLWSHFAGENWQPGAKVIIFQVKHGSSKGRAKRAFYGIELFTRKS